MNQVMLMVLPINRTQNFWRSLQLMVSKKSQRESVADFL
jgi:hypothetical protein